MKKVLHSFYSGSWLAVMLISILFTACQKESPIELLQERITGKHQQSSNAKFAQSSDFDLLDDQEKADLARFLGWIWGDGRPFDTNNGTGAEFKGGHSKYSSTVKRLVAIDLNNDGNINPFNLPESGNRKLLPNIWDYWDNALPGGNPGDPQVLRDALRNPNFLAGLIDGEGFIAHSSSKDYYIDDHTYAPSNPEKSLYGILNFGPERMNQLFCLLGETYGFTNTEMHFGNKKFVYATQHCEAMEALRTRYDLAKATNENPATGNDIFTVKIIINPADFATLKGYGYFPISTGKYRTPAPDNDGTLNILTGDKPEIIPEVQGGMTFFEGGSTGIHISHTETNGYLNSDLDLVPFANDNTVSWELVDLGNGYFRIVSLDDSKTKKWLQAWENGTVKMTGDKSTGSKTQWEQIALSNGSYLLKNKFYADYLRIGNNLEIKRGASGKAAHWTMEEAATCAP